MGGTICRVDRKEGQVGKAWLPIPGCILYRTLNTISEAEKVLGRPVTAIEAGEMYRVKTGN